MTSEFTDMSALSTTPSKHVTHDGRSFKKRGIGIARTLKLLPLDASSSGSAYETGGNSNIKLKKIAQKKDLIEAVRKANSPIVPLPSKDPIVTVQQYAMESNGPDGEGENDGSSSSKDIEIFEDSVNLNARKYNETRMLADRRQKELNGILDELRALQLETQELSRIHNHETPTSKHNFKIKEEIASCTASMEEQMHLRRQLEHMIRRLQNNQLRVDAHVQSMSKAVDASSAEAEEVKLLCRQLEAGKSRAIQFLQDIQGQIQIERKVRARELGDYEIRAKNAQRMEQWRISRIAERAEIAAELRGDLSAEEEAQLVKSIEIREKANEELMHSNYAKNQKAADYENVLAQLKLATGATCLTEVVEKITAQITTSSSLEKEKTQAETRLISCRLEKEQALLALNELKASGIGGIELNREVYNTLENEILQAKATLKVNKAAYERLDGVISAVRQGSMGLAQRLQAFEDVLRTPEHLDLPQESSSNNFKSLDHMNCFLIAEAKLTKILEIVGQQNGSVNSFNSFTGTSGNGGENGDTEEAFEEAFEEGGKRAEMDERHMLWSPAVNNDPILHRNNIRVKPNSRKSGRGVSSQPQVPPPHPSSGAPGRTSSNKQPVHDDDDDEDEQILSARSDTSGTEVLDPVSAMDTHVPSRDILKMSSSRHFAEVMRKKELQEKQKLAAEKGISDEEMVAKMKKRSQIEADARLSTSPSKSYLPPGVNIKDDAMTKSYAFVTQLTFNDL